MAGYEVVPGALRKSQQAWDFCAGGWTAFGQELGAMHLGDGDMGLIGRMAGFPADYNQAIAEIEKKVRESVPALEDSSHALDQVAKEYEARDEEYYKQFGYTADKLDDSQSAPKF